MPQRTPLLARVLGLTCALALLAAITVTVMPGPDHPPERLSTSSSARPVVVINPTAIPADALPTTTTSIPPPPTTRPPATRPTPAASAEVEAAIAAHFSDVYDQAVRVADCESSLNSSAVSPDGSNWGLFQINTVHRADFEAFSGRPWADVLVPDLNAAYARKLYDGHGGWRRDWACAWAAG